MIRQPARDERERSIDDAADRVSYLVLAFGVLGVVAWRGFVDHAQSWDLLALVVGAGAIGTGYRYIRRGMTRSWLLWAGITIVVAIAVAIIVAALR